MVFGGLYLALKRQVRSEAPNTASCNGPDLFLAGLFWKAWGFRALGACGLVGCTVWRLKF